MKWRFLLSADHFEVESDTGKLFAIEPLDREKRSLYFLKIKATLNSSKTKRQLQVNVIGLSGIVLSLYVKL